MLLIVDNYDSFVFNVVRYFSELGEDVRVVRNDGIDVAGIAALKPEALIVSPGPGAPEAAGVSLPAIRQLSGHIPILGVCLGHQCLGAAFGGAIDRARTPMHGRVSPVEHGARGLFAGLPSPLAAGRYHSLIVTPTPAMCAALTIEATSPEGEIMALAHRSHPSYGVQFHPESVLSEHGHGLFANFLALARRWRRGEGC